MIGIVDYNQDLERAKRFLTQFRDEDGVSKYMNLLQQISNREENVIRIDLDDLSSFEPEEEFSNRIELNTARYQRIFSEAIDVVLPKPTHLLPSTSSFDIITDWRKHATSQLTGETEIDNMPPPALQRCVTSFSLTYSSGRYELYFKLPSVSKPLVIRNVRAAHIGSLVKVHGGHELYQTVNDLTYTPLLECKSEECKKNKTTGKVFPEIRGCKFVKFQEVRIQEMPEDVPVGHVPRMMTIHVTGANCRVATAGDYITITGIFLPIRNKGFAPKGLLADTFLECMQIINNKKSYTSLELTSEMKDSIENASKDPDIYNKLAKSIAPEIYGNEDVKKALLCLMVGGYTRTLADVMIRGNINILLVGDPGVAKSQFLKHIGRIAPRAIYTTGKGSSGVGLTAAVLKDPVTKESVLEGGALVLADMGICCIDEFDKMEDADRTAIHEVMEQQTVSISKAGINTVLNARTSILAAANPIGSRYNPSLSVQQNIDLPVALTSRFDLLFIIIDKVDWDRDSSLARHICLVHQNNIAPELNFSPFSSDFLRGYISMAKNFNPYIPPKLTNMIVTEYTSLRMQKSGSDSRQNFCTARVLLSILRLSQALAKIKFQNEVTEADVQEGIRLIITAQASVTDSARYRDKKDPESAIFSIIRDYANNTKKNTVKISEIEPTVIMRGYTGPLLQQTLEKYQDLNVWQLNRFKTSLTFITSRHSQPRKDVYDFDDDELTG